MIFNQNQSLSISGFCSIPAVIGGAVVGLLCAILVVMFIVYRMRKKDEGSYALDEPKRSPAVNTYAKNPNSREFYAWAERHAGVDYVVDDEYGDPIPLHTMNDTNSKGTFK